jgi:hypothetical protein
MLGSVLKTILLVIQAHQSIVEPTIFKFLFQKFGYKTLFAGKHWLLLASTEAIVDGLQSSI